MSKQPVKRLPLFIRYNYFFISLFILTGCNDTSAPLGQQTPVVSVVDVRHVVVTPSKDYVVHTKAVNNVNLRARVQGYLIQQLFTEGSFVQKGEMLFKVDPTEFKIALNKAQAQLDIDKTKTLESERNLKRGKDLITKKLISQEAYDRLISAAQQDNAAVEASMAVMAHAKLNLSYTNIIAPFNGMIGLSNYNPGSFVSTSDPLPLATITSIDPIYVTFAVNEQDFFSYFSMSDNIQQLKKRLSLQLTLSSGLQYAEKGTLNFIDPVVNRDTDTITLRASFPNSQKKLRPGMYATVRVSDTKNKMFLAIPQISVQQGKNGAFVYVVKHGRVRQRDIKLGSAEGIEQTILDGITPEDKIIVQGFLNVRNGKKVAAVEAIIDKNGNIKPKTPPKNENKTTNHNGKHKIKL